MMSVIGQKQKDRYIGISILLSIYVIFSSTSITIIPYMTEARGLGPAHPACWELGSCDLFNDPLNAMIQPWKDDFGPIIYIIFWGIIIGIIWLRTHHTLMVGIIGAVIAGFIVSQGGFATCPALNLSCLDSINPNIALVGGGLLALSIGIVIYQLIFVRSLYPQN